MSERRCACGHDYAAHGGEGSRCTIRNCDCCYFGTYEPQADGAEQQEGGDGGSKAGNPSLSKEPPSLPSCGFERLSDEAKPYYCPSPRHGWMAKPCACLEAINDPGAADREARNDLWLVTTARTKMSWHFFSEQDAADYKTRMGLDADVVRYSVEGETIARLREIIVGNTELTDRLRARERQLEAENMFLAQQKNAHFKQAMANGARCQELEAELAKLQSKPLFRSFKAATERAEKAEAELEECNRVCGDVLLRAALEKP